LVAVTPRRRDAMELADAIKARRMCRSFTGEPLQDGQLDRLLDHARRVPSAGFTQGFHFLVLEGQEQTSRFWDHTMPAEVRTTFSFPRVLDAPVIVLPLADANAYVTRYAEADKARSGLGEGADRWPVPFWWADTAMAVQNLLLAVVAEGLGALYFGIFRNEADLLNDLGVPVGIRPLGAVAIGHPTADAFDKQEGSPARRPRRALETMIHRNGWTGQPSHGSRTSEG
jgi:nitroreductase